MSSELLDFVVSTFVDQLQKNQLSFFSKVSFVPEPKQEVSHKRAVIIKIVIIFFIFYKILKNKKYKNCQSILNNFCIL